MFNAPTARGYWDGYRSLTVSVHFILCSRIYETISFLSQLFLRNLPPQILSILERLAATRFAYDIYWRSCSSHFVYYILRLPFDGQFHIVQSDIGNDIIYNVSRFFLENLPSPNFIAPRKDSPPPRYILFILIFIGARVAASHIVVESDIRIDITY